MTVDSFGKIKSKSEKLKMQEKQHSCLFFNSPLTEYGLERTDYGISFSVIRIPNGVRGVTTIKLRVKLL